MISPRLKRVPQAKLGSSQRSLTLTRLRRDLGATRRRKLVPNAPGPSHGSIAPMPLHELASGTTTPRLVASERDLQLLAEIELARAEASVDGWDGHRGRKLSAEVVQRAKEFVRLLPAEIRTPEILPTPNGDIAFDWDRDPLQTFTVTVNGEGRLVFASLLGEETVHGYLPPLRDRFPGRVAAELERLFPEEQ
jgi:hypothetical protein